jgi:hypothetical protein
MKAWGFKPGPVRAAFAKMSAAWDQATAARDGADPACFDEQVRAAVEASLQGFVALDAYDGTIYPQQQVQGDAWFLGKAVVSLRHGDWQTALESLRSVAQVWYVPLLAKDWFEAEMAHHDPAHPKIAWGGQGHLAPYLDLWDVYMSIRGKGRAGSTDFSDETASLRRTRDREMKEFGARLDELVTTMRDVTNDLEAAAGC